jgi:hypothetical protein
MTVEIVYETHSVTTDNEAGIATGWLPGQLSDEGREHPTRSHGQTAATSSLSLVETGRHPAAAARARRQPIRSALGVG